MNPSSLEGYGTQTRNAIRHAGPCSGIRLECWLERCRAAFTPYRTVEVLVDRDGDLLMALAWCHRARLRSWELPAGVADYLATRAA